MYISRILLIIIAIFTNVLTALLPKDTHADSDVHGKPLLVLGDSLSAAHGIPITNGWVSLLDNKLKNLNLNMKIINASISGETTQGGAARIQALIDKHNPHYLILELGANDGLRGLPLTQMKHNLDLILKTATQHKLKTLVLGMRIPPNYGIQYAQQFNEMYIELAKKYKQSVIPFFLKGILTDYSLLQADRLHPTAEAQPLILERIWPQLKTLLAPQ